MSKSCKTLTPLAAYLSYNLPRDTYAGGAGGAAAPSALIHGRQEGQELPFILNSFHLSYLLKGHFPAFQTVCCKKIFLGGSPQTPPTAVQSLGDYYSKHCSSGKEFTDQNLPPWRSIHINRCALRSLVPLP